MTPRNDINPDLDHHHARAVCQGIGERLRDSLQPLDASSRLKQLFARLPELDDERAPSLVPSSHNAF